MLRTDGVLKPDGLSSATDADHGEGTMGTAQRAVVRLADNEGAGLAQGGCCRHLREVRERKGAGGLKPSDSLKIQTKAEHLAHYCATCSGVPADGVGLSIARHVDALALIEPRGERFASVLAILHP